MRRFSAPPMIILLDVVFVILFVLALEQSPNMKIVLPQKQLNDVVIVSTDHTQKVKHWYNSSTNSWENLESFIQKYPKTSFIAGHIECKPYDYCQDILPAPDHEEKRIYLKGELLKELSMIITDSALKYGGISSNVTYYIKDDGSIDKERLKKEYQIFRLILKE